ncbi:MAG: hypothetical protein V3T31_06540 [candidate division Zixibacteria bacterium]
MKRILQLRIVLTAVAMIVCLACTMAVAADGVNWIGAFFVKGKVGLKWQAAEGATEYIVYRQADGGEFEKLATVTKTQHFDTEIKGGSVYSYKIAFAGADGAELMSIEKSVSIPGAAAGSFVPPTWSGLRLDRQKIMMRWDKVPGAIAYNIYRSKTSGEGYEVIGNATSSRHADNVDLVMGETYYYVITGLNDEFEETEYSEERSFKFGIGAEERKAMEEAAQVVLEDTKLTYLFDITQADGEDMNQPADIAVNSVGDIYISGGLVPTVSCFDADGKFKFSFGEKTPTDDKDHPPEGTFTYPFTLFIDKSDQVYVSDVVNHDIQVFSPDGKFIKRIRVTVDEGQEQFRPNGIHVFDDGRIAATDAGNHRFVILDQSGKILKSIGTRGVKASEFTFPDGLVVTPDNTVVVVDVINCRIQMFDSEGNFIREFGESGQTAGTFGRPKEVCYDEAASRLWISDAMGNIVQIFDMNGEVKSAITSFEDESMRLISPRGVLVKNGRFYVVNRLPHRLMVFKIG